MKHNITFTPTKDLPSYERKVYGTRVGSALDASPYVLCQECGHYSHPAETVYNDWSENLDCPGCGSQVAGKTAFREYYEKVLLPAVEAKNRQWEEKKAKL